MARRRRPIRIDQSIRGVSAGGNVRQIVRVGPENELDSAAGLLAEKVLADLENEVGCQELNRPHPIGIRWSRTERPGAELRGTAGRQTLRDGDVTQISALIRELPRRQLVVLGRRGAGKSVLALLVARDMARSRKPGEPVPVLLPLSSWRPRLDLHTWMAKRILAICPELATDYDRETAARLVERGRVIPILDGLDELPRALHAPAIEAIDKAVPDTVPLMVTCRAGDYERAVAASGQYLTRAEVVRLEEVKPTTAVAFLRESATSQDRWEPVFDHLQAEPDSPLAEALASPLMLYLARTAYRPSDKDPADLLRYENQEAIESHLLENYVSTVYAESSRRRHRPRQVRRWLEFMARRMRDQNTVDFTWRQVISPFTVPLFALVYGTLCGWFWYLFFGVTAALVTFSVTGIASAVLVFFLRMNDRQERDEDHGDLTSTLRRQALATALVSAVGAGSTMLLAALWLNAEVGVAPGVAWRYGVILGLGFGSAVLLGSSWVSYVVSHVWFWLTRRLPRPWRLADFLEEGHRLGVLRPAGPAYQFRNVRLLEQLSGTAWSPDVAEDEPQQAVAEEAPWWRRWIQPVKTMGVLLGLMMMVIAFLFLFADSVASQQELSYRSGHQPASFIRCDPYDPQGTGGCVVRDTTHTWTLQAASTMDTVFDAPSMDRYSGLRVDALNGILKADGCSGTSVQVLLTVGDLRLRPFVLRDGTSRSAPVAGFGGDSPAIGPVRITLRRLDGRPCALRVHWSNPGIHIDRYGDVRRRLS
ncbi:NACHT domain-containing protein [Actinomadura sp. NPDC047616]|uniref:NACHT domain-containing protein n=1 Tax=Actinomadura sp. NPDC047616 TaxID=3155914 RepID=UPI0033E612AF